MKKRYTEEQILGVLKEAESGKPVAQVLREQGVSPQTYYRWKRKYGGLEPSQLSRLRELERENSQLKRIVAD
jgi:putative transposase